MICFAKFYRPSERLIVDEIIVKFKGQWPWKLQVLFDHCILFVVRLQEHWTIQMTMSWH